jgi:hypothetical protein
MAPGEAPGIKYIRMRVKGPIPLDCLPRRRQMQWGPVTKLVGLNEGWADKGVCVCVCVCVYVYAKTRELKSKSMISVH